MDNHWIRHSWVSWRNSSDLDISLSVCLKAGPVLPKAVSAKITLGGFAIAFQHSSSQELIIAQNANDDSFTLCKGLCGVFDVHQIMLADGMPRLTYEYIQGIVHLLMQHPTCDAPIRQFIVSSGFKPKPDGSNVQASVWLRSPPVHHW